MKKITRSIIIITVMTIFIFSLISTGCNLNGDGIFKSISKAEELTPEEKDLYSSNADRILGIISDGDDYLLVQTGGEIYINNINDTEKWVPVTAYEETTNNPLNFNNELSMADNSLFGQSVDDISDDDENAIYYDLDISSSIIDGAYDPSENSMDLTGFSSNSSNSTNDPIHQFGAVDDKLFYITAKNDNEFYLNFDSDEFLLNDPNDLNTPFDEVIDSISSIYGIKATGPTYNFLISGWSESDKKVAEIIYLKYDGSNFSEIDEDLDVDPLDSDSSTDGIQLNRISGFINPDDTSYPYYVTTDDRIFKLGSSNNFTEISNYPDDFLLNDKRVPMAYNSDKNELYFAGVISSSSSTTGIVYTYNLDTDSFSSSELDFNGSITDLYFYNTSNTLYISVNGNWILSYDVNGTDEPAQF
ncbi:MAG: hypothetical protein K9L75_05785 [Spirochaetia bacterium]|nr:hypothetical protein [Spirochaetia bacterium]